MADVQPYPGWYADPNGAPGTLRYWDGAQWTEQTQSAENAGGASPAYAQMPQRASYAAPVAGVKSVNKVLYILMAWFFGAFGVHRFLRGQVGLGILYLFTLGGIGIAALVDFIISLVKLSNYSGMEEYQFTISPRGHWTR